MACIVEAICIGNELLIGQIVNTNAQWLAKYITSLGGKVRRISIVGDSFDEISSALRGSLLRKPTFIITTGGLGPTFDDKTLKSMAKTLKIPLELNETALDMVREKYHLYGEKVKKTIELTPARLKMATLPRGAVPLPNPVGTAPGVLLESESSKIVALPGVPGEMKAIFEDSVVPMISDSVGSLSVYGRSLRVKGIIESEIAPLIDATMHENPYVYVKSHPKAPEPIPLLELYFTATSKSRGGARKLVEEAVKMISPLIRERGGKIEDV
jgi:nicotinamide-nucleotide amidase